MSEVVRIIDEYKDAHGQPSDASIARALGVSPGTLSAWRKRGIKSPPEAETLRALAVLARLPYAEYVLQAALVDAGWRESMPELEDARRRERATRSA